MLTFPDQESDAAERALGSTACALQKLAGRLHGGASKTVRHEKFDAQVLVAMHSLAPHLRNHHLLRTAIILGTQVALPGVRGQGMVEHIPSDSYMRKRQVCYDAALLLLRRARDSQNARQGGSVRWLWADSSPQAGYDWMQVKELHASAKDLPVIFSAVADLAIANIEGQELCLDVLQCHNATIEGKLQIHMKIPTAKASGHQGLKQALPDSCPA